MPLTDRWNDTEAAGLSEPELLHYRSNLLGADLRVTNYGGGNTSAKIDTADPLTSAPTTVLWVKGSGGDLGSMGLDGFATLYQARLTELEGRYRGLAHEDEMVGLLRHCIFDANPRAPSIDTPLHAFLPFAHVDHMHPDAVIAIAAARDSQRLTTEVFGGALAWLPWQRPGFDLALRLRDAVRAQPDVIGVMLAGHGLFTWGDTAKACYARTLSVVRRAEAWIAERTRTATVFGGIAHANRSPAERRTIAAALMPLLRGRLSAAQRKVGHFRDDEDVLEFVGSARLAELAALGTSCPDHFLRTKVRPLILPPDPERVVAELDGALDRYRADYEAYYKRCRHADSSPMRDSSPVVLLMPGVGLCTFAKDKATARIASEFYVNAIHVMRGASTLDKYVGLAEQEAFDIEYWQLEAAKLRRQPAPKALAGRVALVTGGGGGIGRAVADRLLAADACVVLLDIDAAALEAAAATLRERHGDDRIRTAASDVTDESSVARAFDDAMVAYGGLDVVVSNAGLASSAPIEETTLEIWNRNLEVLTTGYFLVAREAAGRLKRQGLGGSVVFVGSKNALAASPQAAAYCTAKASELHLARCLAVELAPDKIRVSVVNPDAVLRGSRIWSGAWRAERAAAYGVDAGELESYYRNRSLLKESVYPEDVADAVYFFASDRSGKSRGNIINVDAGNVTAFPR